MEEKFFDLEDISKEFPAKEGSLKVLEAINISVKEHEFISIMGPSGCGKSILLKIAAGLITPSSGGVFFEQQRFEKGFPKDKMRNFGFVFQRDNLFPWRSCEANLKLSLEVMRLKGPVWKERVDEMLNLVGLSDYRKIFPHEMSGGMRQRAGIARALVHDPKILIMDQPFGALDVITRKMLAYELLNIWKTTQKTVLFVTNAADEALLLSNRIFFLSPKPSGIVYEYKVKIPTVDRNPQMLENPAYLSMLETIDDIVRNTDAKEGAQ